MDNEMINRVAEAMWKADKWHSKFQDIKETSALYPKKLEFIDQAKAAIKAMREPTEKMINAADVSVQGEFYPPNMTWQMMIDCILND